MEDNALTRITEKIATINSISEIESFQQDLKTICDSRWNELLRWDIENSEDYFNLVKLYPKMNSNADVDSCKLFILKTEQLLYKPINKSKKLEDLFVFDEHLENFVNWGISHVFTEKVKLFLPTAIKTAKNEEDVSHLKYWIRLLPEVRKIGIFEKLLKKKECNLGITDTYKKYTWNNSFSFDYVQSTIFLDDIYKKC